LSELLNEKAAALCSGESSCSFDLWYKVGTQFGTQKGAERATKAVDAVRAVRILL